MENDKELVTDEVTENTEEQPVEEVVTEGVEEPTANEPEKIYTEEDFNKKLDELLAKKIARKEDKIRRDYEKKYGRAEALLKAGMQKDTLEDATDELEQFYVKKGMQVPSTPQLTDEQNRILADNEARKIIECGYDDVVDELKTLTDKGYENLDKYEKQLFTTLNTKRAEMEEIKALNQIGIKKEDLPSDFEEFAKNLNPNLSYKDKYELYKKYNPKEEGKILGSMKNTTQAKEKKTYYTPEEARKLTSKDLDDPEVMKAVEKSMERWYKENIR